MRARGFTLVELLVAIAVLAIVAVLGWRGLDGIVRSRQALTEQMEQTRGIQLAFAQLQSDLEQLADGTLMGARPNLVADAQRMSFVRTMFNEGEATRLQVVTYRIQEGVLTRRESLPTRDLMQLDQLWQTALGDADATPGIALQAGATAMTVRIWDRKEWRPANGGPANGGQANGSPTAPPSTRDGPTGLELALQMQGQESPLSKIFLLGAK